MGAAAIIKPTKTGRSQRGRIQPTVAIAPPTPTSIPRTAGLAPQSHPINGTAKYPLHEYLEAGVRVTVNTDNLGISAATLSDNLLLLARLCPGLTRRDLIQLQRNALEAAFVGSAHRSSLLREASPKPPTIVCP